MFYGAYDLDTAIKETYEEVEEDKKAVCGIFKPTRELNFVDLTEVYIPSLFDEQNQHNRVNAMFLYDFVKDFTKPIERNDRAHVDYVPTQIVTEFFRHIFKAEDNKGIDGVIYPSTKNDGAKALVVFADSDQCVGNEQVLGSESAALLQLVGIENYEVKGKKS